MITIDKAKELISERAKDLGLTFALEDIRVIETDDAKIVWLKTYNYIDNVYEIHIDITEETYTLYVRIPELVFVLWDSGIVFDKIRAITLPRSIKV